MFGLSGEAAPRKRVNWLRTAPKQQKISTKTTEQLHGCPLVPGEAAGRWHCPAGTPGQGHLLLQPSHQRSTQPENLPFGKAFSQGSGSAVLATRGRKTWIFSPKSKGGFLRCAERQSSPSSDSSAGTGLILLCRQQLAAICLPPQNPTFSLSPLARPQEKTGWKCTELAGLEELDALGIPNLAILEQPWLSSVPKAHASHGLAGPDHSILLCGHQGLQPVSLHSQEGWKFPTLVVSAMTCPWPPPRSAIAITL